MLWAILMRQCVSSKECVCEHDRLAEGIDHRSELLLFRHWIHTMICYRSLDFTRWHALAWGQHNDGVILNNKSAKLLYISNKNNQNYRKQCNLTAVLTNNEAKRYKRTQLKYSVNKSLSFFELRESSILTKSCWNAVRSFFCFDRIAWTNQKLILNNIMMIVLVLVQMELWSVLLYILVKSHEHGSIEKPWMKLYY